MTLAQVYDQVIRCQRCELHKTKRNYVFGKGSEKAKIMFIGEAPGANEDLTGEPFVGKAGQIFEELLKSISLKREDVYVANILKCRPPENRSPLPREIDECTRFLVAQINTIKPTVICPMGNFAVMFILKHYGLSDKIEGISKIHGKPIELDSLFGTLSIIPLYHPAVSTYNPYTKTTLLADFKQLEKYK
jgi:DNA polymerase